MNDYLLFISGGELVLVMLLALLFFGAKAIPDIAKTLGKGMREFKKATNEIKREIDEHTSDFKKDINEVKSAVNRETSKIKQGLNDVTSEVDREAREIGQDLNSSGTDSDTGKKKDQPEAIDYDPYANNYGMGNDDFD